MSVAISRGEGELPAAARRDRYARSGGRNSSVHSRGKVFASANIYFATYVIAYVWWVTPAYDYFGLGLREDLTAVDVAIVWVIAVLPSVLLHDRFTRPSHFLQAVQYVIVYVPATWLVLNSSRPLLDRGDAWLLLAALFVSMTGQLLMTARLPVFQPPVKPARRRFFLLTIGGLTALMFAYLFAQIGASFQFVSFEDIYDLRALAAEGLAASGSRLGSYFFNWLSSVLLPFGLAVGLFYGLPWLVVGASTGFVLLFGLWGSKAVLLAPFVIWGVFRLVRPRRAPAMRRLFAACCALLLFPIVLYVLDPNLQEFVSGWYLSIVHQRTFSSSALLIPQYLDFFQNNPLTFGSHITGVNAFITYPYDLDIPRSVGIYTYGGPVTANVNYWAQDGIAGFGLAGIPLVAILAALLYWLVDCAAARLDTRFAIVCVAFVAMQLSDTSLFTSFVTGGAGLLIVLFAKCPWPLLRVSTTRANRSASTLQQASAQ